MAQNNELVYNETIVEQAKQVFGYCYKFCHFLDKDYDGNTFGFSDKILETLCIDVDEYEKSQPSSNQSSMDLMTGISSFNPTSQKESNLRLLPVELKLFVGSKKGLEISELKFKNDNTRTRFSGQPIDEHSVFIYTERVVNQVKHIISQYSLGKNSSVYKKWEIMTPKQYNDYIKFRTDFPYIPINDLSTISNEIKQLCDKNEIEQCIDIVDEWIDKAKDYERKYNVNECNAICSMLLEVIQDILNSMSKDENNDIEYLALRRDDINNMYVK